MKSGGGQPNMQQLLKQAQKMQRDLADAQAELENTEIEGSAAGGLVTAIVTGAGQVVSIRIDPSVVDRDDVETLEDLVVAAIKAATRQASDLQSARMGPLTGGRSGLGLPGIG